MRHLTKEYAAEAHEAGHSIMDCACWYRTAFMAVDHGPFEKGQCVSVNWTRTAFNHVSGRYEDLFDVWAGSGEKYPSELFARALDRFCQ